MRVLVVSARWDLVGGSERYAGEVVRGLLARGLQVTVLCEQGQQDAGEHLDTVFCPGLTSPGLTKSTRQVLRVAHQGCTGTLVLSRISNGALRELLQGPPLVRFAQDHTLFCPGLNKMLGDHQPCEQALGLACMERYWLGAGCAGQRVEGFPSLVRPLRNLNRALTEIRLLQGAKRLLVASDYMRQELVRAGFKPSHVETLPYFSNSKTQELPSSELEGSSREFWQGSRTFKLFCPARLVLPDKGIDFLLSTLGKLPAEVKLVIAGDGPARDWLVQKAKEEHLQAQVLFTGWCEPQQIEAHYSACDAVVFPSVWNEPFGLVGLEAMAHSKPVVAFDVGGVRQWMLPNETGLCVERRDTQAMAESILRLLRDPAYAQRLGQRGKAHLDEHFSSKRHMERLAGILLD